MWNIIYPERLLGILQALPNLDNFFENLVNNSSKQDKTRTNNEAYLAQ